MGDFEDKTTEDRDSSSSSDTTTAYKKNSIFMGPHSLRLTSK